jgi:WD40 repeat protein
MCSSGSEIFTGSDDHDARRWRCEDGLALTRYVGHTGGVKSIVCVGGTLFTGSVDFGVIVWEVVTGVIRRRLRGHDGGVRCLAVNGPLLFSGGGDAVLCVWEHETGRLVSKCTGHLKGVLVEISAVLCVKVCPATQLVYTGSTDKEAIAWEAATGRLVRRYRGLHTDEVVCLELSSDGKLLFTGSLDAEAVVWEAATAAVLKRFQGHTKGLVCMALSLDIAGRPVLFTGSDDGAALSFGTESAQPRAHFRGHTGGVWCLTVADGVLFTGSSDRAVIAWNAETGQALRRFTGLYGSVLCLVVVGELLVAGSKDTTATSWHLPPEVLAVMRMTARIRKLEETVQRAREPAAALALGGEGEERSLDCPVCLGSLADPVTFPCGHSVCSTPCFQRMTLSGVPGCPECRAPLPESCTFHISIKLRDALDRLFLASPSLPSYPALEGRPPGPATLPDGITRVTLVPCASQDHIGALLRCVHPNVITLYGRAGDATLVTEFVDERVPGAGLEALLDTEKSAASQAIQAAVQAVHAAGYALGTIESESFVVSTSGQIKIKALERTRRLREGDREQDLRALARLMDRLELGL